MFRPDLQGDDLVLALVKAHACPPRLLAAAVAEQFLHLEKDAAVRAFANQPFAVQEAAVNRRRRQQAHGVNRKEAQ